MRYVIKNPTAGYFTELVPVRSKAILAPMEMVLHPDSPPVAKGSQIGTEVFYAPQFEAFKPSQAIQFDTAEDAEGQIKNVSGTLLDDATVFDNCTVEPSV